MEQADVQRHEDRRRGAGLQPGIRLAEKRSRAGARRSQSHAGAWRTQGQAGAWRSKAWRSKAWRSKAWRSKAWRSKARRSRRIPRCELLGHSPHELRVALAQVVVGDALRARHQIEREGERALPQIARRVLEPLHRGPRGALQARDLAAALLLVARER